MYEIIQLIYLVIFLISLLITDVHNTLMKKTDLNSFKEEKILFVSDEPSLLQCAQRCRFIDKNAIVDFKNSRCTCLKYEVDEGQEHLGTLTGVFVKQKIVKAKAPKTVQTRVMNVALNKPAEQSSVWVPDNVAKSAVDGSMDTASSTDTDRRPIWWSVDLKNVFTIKHIIIRSKPFKIGQNRALSVYTKQNKDGEWKTCKVLGDLVSLDLKFKCDKETNARYVKIQSGDDNARITLYEFEVYAPVIV